MNIVQKNFGYSSNCLQRFDTGAQLTPRRRIKRRETDVVGIPAQHQLAEDAAPQSPLDHLDDGAVLRRDGGDARAYAGIFPAEAADDLRQPVLGNAGIRPDAQLILLRGAQGAHRVLEGVALAQDPLDIHRTHLLGSCYHKEKSLTRTNSRKKGASGKAARPSGRAEHEAPHSRHQPRFYLHENRRL